MKKFTLLLISLLIAFTSMQAQRANVTFHVNINQVTDMHPGGSVWLLFGNWDQWYYMDDSDADGIYTYTVDTTVSATLNYSFSYQTGPDEWNDYVQETVPEGCANAEGFRELLVPATDTTLPAFYYETCSELLMTDITFSVDLNGITDLYADGGVWVYTSTDWSEWADMTDEDGDSVYSATVSSEAGTTQPYIFSYQTGPDAWNDYVVETVPGTCANNEGFRELTVPDSDSVLPVFSYENCTGNNMVNYRVDLSGISDKHEGGSVWVLFGDWVDYYYLEDPDGDQIYSITLTTVADTAIPYKFSYQTGPDEWNDYVVETVPEECANVDGYRELIVEEGYTVLPAVAYGSCTETPLAKVNITFSVDMSYEAVINNDVQVVIKEPWIWTALVDQENGIWSATVEVNANSTYPFTFVNGGVDNWGGEEKLPDECNMGTPGAPERHVTVLENDTILDVVVFGSCTDEPVGKVNVTFSVDMSNETVSGEGVQLVVKGPWIWTPMTDMGDGIWETTLALNQNSTYPYTFVNGAQDDWSGEESVPEECNFGTASAPERRVELTEKDTILPTVSFGACAITRNVNVTFRVDMNDETVSGDGVQVVIKEPWLWTALSDAGDGIWEATIVLPGNTSYPFSFVNGAIDYWAGEEVIVGDCKDGDNNQRLAEIGEGDTTLMAFVFGTCAERSTGISPDAGGALSVYPNPATSFLYIDFNDRLMQRVSIVDITGRVVLDRRIENLHRLSVDVSDLSEGLYIVVVEGENARAVSRITIKHTL
jgi:hypothetical protein